ncbi:hypothetical protein [Actinacidiphila sp. bgisy160]|uniref:hypothetical protein n=1 Tax=Actinacidiphila sp. bgisy160 TaxID=3413796 RepID=UPI003D7628DA
MASVTRKARSVEHTAESLQEDLLRLEAQRQALERELAAVVAHLGSVQRALGALQAVMRTPAPAAAPPDAAALSHTGRTYGRLTEQIMDFFERTGDTEVRARDVAAALGRDGDSGSINAVRSTLDRLVGASRLDRAGRGLYRAHRS